MIIKQASAFLITLDEELINKLLTYYLKSGL